MSGKNQQSSIDVKQKNVLNAPLHKHSSERSTPTSSLPSTLSTGTCTSRTPIAAILTTPFLDFARTTTGTDLRKAGLEPGQRVCLDAGVWKSAAEADDDVPRVKLEATHVAALKSVGMDVLKRWAAEPDAEGKKDRVVRPKEGSEGWARESGDIGARDARS